MTSATAKTDTTPVFAPMTAEEFAAHNDAHREAQRVASKRHTIQEHEALSATYKNTEDAARTVAQHIRGLITFLEAKELGGITFDYLTNALSEYTYKGESAQTYAAEYTRKAKRLRDELEGSQPVTDGTERI